MQSAKTDMKSAGNEAPREKRVGELLRDARLEKDQNLKTVSDMLKIRLPYLEAIEESRPGDLPGTTYAIGFVRAYSDHLGLETPRMVEQFKKEAAELENQTTLHFPEPLPGGRVPGGAILFVCVLLVGLIYGAWMYLSSQGRPIAEIVPAIPEQLSSLVGLGDEQAEGDGAPQPAPETQEDVASDTEAPVEIEGPPADAETDAVDTASETPQPVTETVPPLDEEVAESAAAAEAQAEPAAEEAVAETAAVAEGIAQQAVEAGAGANEATTVQTDTAEVVDAAGETVTQGAGEATGQAADATDVIAETAEETVAEAVEEGTEEAAETIGEEAAETAAAVSETVEEATPEPVEEATEPAVEATATEPVAEPGAETAAVTEEIVAEAEAAAETEVAAVTEPSPPAPQPTPGGPRIYGEENADARVVITAESAAWVEITAPSGELVLTRLLNTGDSYRVPNTDGLTLVTGNAGGLQITVDGEAVSPIGPVGSVRRDVLLEPDALKSRN